MKTFILLVCTIMLIGCGKPNVDIKRTDIIVREGYNSLNIIEIDGCQYFYGDWGNATVLTHKGNCNNPIHTKEVTNENKN